MFLGKRETEIVSLINQQGSGTVKDLAERFGVTEVTIRRDLTKLEQLSLLKRTHGGAVSLSNGFDWSSIFPEPDDDGEDVIADALILPPVDERVAHTLCERALRNHIPLIAESCPQENAIYLGHANFEVGHALGIWTGEYFHQHMGVGDKAVVLDITLRSLPNTSERSDGFIAGLTSILGADNITLYSIEGNGLYDDAYQVTKDTLHLHPEINILFGINDDSILAGIQAHADLEGDTERLIAVGVGAEGKTMFDTLAQRTPLKACAALFPEIVGRMAIDAVVRLWRDESVPDALITPYRILTPDNLAHYYSHKGRDWEFNTERFAELLSEDWQSQPYEIKNRTVSFAVIFRTHEWYQNVVKALRSRAQEYGIDVRVDDWKADLRDEIRALRRLIGKLAASYIDDGDVIILDSGVPTEYMTPFLREFGKLAVVTNSMNILQRLQGYPNIELITTGGKFDPGTRSFIGRGAHLLLRDMRVDKVFIAAKGVSVHFGISAASEMEADIQRSMIAAAREVIILADHTLLDADSTFHVAGLDSVHTLITDTGITASQRLDLADRSIKVLLTGEVSSTS